MSSERLVKWSKESQEFFEKAEDNSVILDLVISFGCASQTGEGFEELVNTINSENIKRKVKKVVITDTSYLYRHTIPHFSKYSDPNIPTEWFLKNKSAIEKLKVDTELKSWVSGLESDGFKDWYRKIKQDFFTDSNFKSAVIQLAMEFTTKNFYDAEIGGSIDFILEETAYTAFNLNSANVVYPTGISEPVDISLRKYNLGTKFLSYKVSNHAQCHSVRILDRAIVDKEVIKFIKEKTTNVNFFVVDREGNIIYMNQSLGSIVCEKNAKQVSQITWENSLKVMEKKDTLAFEETDKNKEFLSVKSPLVINGKVEGVIGLAVDITDRKKKEELENKLKMREELYKIAKEVSHDIASPVTSLKIIEEVYKGKLREEDERMLNTAIRSIEGMTGKMLDNYRINRNREEGRKEEEGKKKEDEEILVKEMLGDIVENMRYRSKGEGVEIKIEREKEEGIVCIKGDKADFRRMMVNVIKNGVEAIEGKKGEIEVGYREKGEEVEIRVKDNGKGMSRCMVEKLERGEEVGTTKKGGYGIGMGQVMGVIREMRGKIKIESREGEGTEFILTFPKSESPI